MKYIVELRNKDFALLDRLEDEVQGLRWSYSRIGGDGEFSFNLPRKLFEEKSLSGLNNIRIYAQEAGTYNLWYQGRIEVKSPSVRGNTETISVSGHGYQSQLSSVYISNGSVARTYVSTELSVIVTSLLDNYIVPNTNIAYSASDITATTFTPDLIEFNTDAESALQTLANLHPLGAEWGVDKNRNFFFKSKSTTVDSNYKFYLGYKIKDFSENQDFTDIVTRIIVQGAQSGGTYYFNTFNDSAAQTKYGIITKVLQNSSVSTDTVAQQLATATFTEQNEVSRKASIDMVGFEALVEATIPLSLVNVVKKGIRFGQKKFGTFLFSGLVSRKINRINYTLTNNNSLNISLDLGKLKSSEAEVIGDLLYQLEQQRNAAL